MKPVAPILRDIAIFSGNTILGDGSVIMILDPNGIATSAGEITVGSGGARADQAPARATQQRRSDQPAAVPRRRRRAQGGAALAHRPSRGDRSRQDRVLERAAGRAISRQAHADRHPRSEPRAGQGRPPADPGLRRARPRHGPRRRRDRRHRRGGACMSSSPPTGPGWSAARSSPARRPTSSMPAST